MFIKIIFKLFRREQVIEDYRSTCTNSITGILDIHCSISSYTIRLLRSHYYMCNFMNSLFSRCSKLILTIITAGQFPNY